MQAKQARRAGRQGQGSQLIVVEIYLKQVCQAGRQDQAGELIVDEIQLRDVGIDFPAEGAAVGFGSGDGEGLRGGKNQCQADAPGDV